jgi:hypothetical protein
MSLLKELRLAGQSLSVPVVQPLIHGLVEAQAPEMLSDSSSRRGFKVTLGWTRRSLRNELGWSYRSSTTAAGHLQQRVYIKWKSQSCFLAIYGLFSKLPIMYKGKLWKGLTYII